MNPPQGTALIDAGFTGDIELWESFEYPTDALLQAEWIEGGNAGNPTRSATSYYGQYGMQTVVTAGAVGNVHRLLTARNIKTLANLAIAARSNKAAGDTFRFTLYDSSGNYNYWTQTIAVQDTWQSFNINPHSARSGGSTTLVDLEDIVKIDLANLTASSTYIFDLIIFDSLVASKIGLGYNGLSDSANETSSVRGNLLLIRDEISDAGITTFPAAADIANGVSLAEAVRAILTSVVGGDDYDAYTNISNSANASLDAISQKFAVILAADGVNTFNPTMQGAAKTDLELAMNALASYFATGGAAISSTVNPGGSARATLELILEDIGQMLAGANGITTFPAGVAAGDGISMAEALRYASEEVDKVPKSDGTVTWNADALQAIQDEAEDALEAEHLDHLLQLDSDTQKYPENCAIDSILAKLIAKGDPATPSTYDCTTDSLEAISDKVGVVDGLLDVPAKDAVTDAHMREVVGKKDDTAQTTVGTTRSLMGYLKGLLNQVATAITDIGTVDTVVDAIIANQSGAETISSYDLPNDVAENTAITVTTTKRLRLDSVWLDFVNLVQDATIKVYHKIDGTTYRQYDEFSWSTSEEDGILLGDITINGDWKLTITSTVAQGATKAIPYNVIKTQMEA